MHIALTDLNKSGRTGKTQQDTKDRTQTGFNLSITCSGTQKPTILLFQ